MTFDSLAKLYYKDEKHYLTEYEKRYNAPFAYHIDFSVKQNKQKHAQEEFPFL